MTGKRENRRVQMTKRLMKEALIELLEQKELVNISVTAICEAADVHRSTFYKYYSDQADLLRDLEQDYLDQVPMPTQDLGQLDEDELLDETTPFFDYVKRNAGVYRVLLDKSTSSNFSARLIDRLCAKYSESGVDSGSTASRYASLYMANGTVGMLSEWVNSDFSISSREIAEMMYRFSVRVVG